MGNDLETFTIEFDGMQLNSWNYHRSNHAYDWRVERPETRADDHDFAQTLCIRFCVLFFYKMQFEILFRCKMYKNSIFHGFRLPYNVPRARTSLKSAQFFFFFLLFFCSSVSRRHRHRHRLRVCVPLSLFLQYTQKRIRSHSLTVWWIECRARDAFQFIAVSTRVRVDAIGLPLPQQKWFGPRIKFLSMWPLFVGYSHFLDIEILYIYCINLNV